MNSSNTSTSNRELINIRIIELIEEYLYKIDLDADYQREHIWSLKQQEKLLDSIFQDIDIPKLYLVRTSSRNKNFEFECIDGKQRMTCLLNFFKPDENDEPSPKLLLGGTKYTYKKLKEEHHTIAKKIEEYKLSFTIYKEIDDDFVRLIFRRLQLGISLNSGELLRTRTGTIRDFIYKEIGNNGPFFRKTRISKKRFSIPFTLAQICINSFEKAINGKFKRARLEDIEDFFEDYHNLPNDDENLNRIRNVLEIMDAKFDKKAQIISSRAVAVSCYLFSEQLYQNNKENEIGDFASFYEELLNEIKNNLRLINQYTPPSNPFILETFQKYIAQASVEANSIKRRHDFLEKAFEHYQRTGEIINGNS